uniref:Uncharacterized protein n=1 Tax=Medicago truncatula TaxID=3880 RepID=I3SKW3_MEDTR|nr:unknown [Medicago truncatula]
MTSLIELAPASNITNLSRPKAMPPCGGAPMSRASRRYPNLASACSIEMPTVSKTFCCMSRL